jgi:hypothetical protein
MMRLGRGALLLVALFLLTSAATTSAECAWVMWSKVLVSSASCVRVTVDRWLDSS